MRVSRRYTLKYQKTVSTWCNRVFLYLNIACKMVNVISAKVVQLMRNYSRIPVKYKWREVKKSKVFIVENKITNSPTQKFQRQLVLSEKTSSISTEQESTEPNVDHWRAEKSVTTRAYYPNQLPQIVPNYKGSRRRLMNSQDAETIQPQDWR